MSDGVFLLREGHLDILELSGFEEEAILQEALALHPQVIAGQATVGGSAGRLLLISRELGVPISESSGSWFSADHVFIDSEAVPVLVETKRSSDIRSRREVVAQLLEYAANGTKYWTVDRMEEALEARAVEEGKTGSQLLEAIDPTLDPEQFWKDVAGNLSEGRVRLVIVCDQLRPELERLIEFLNEQMTKTELLGVELRHYTDGKQRVLVPRVVGQTQRAADMKVPGQVWTEETFLEAASARCSPSAAEASGRLLEHVHSSGGRLRFGRAASPGVTGWYRLGVTEAPVWTMNLGPADGGWPANVYTWPVEDRVAHPAAAAFGGLVRQIGAFSSSTGKSPGARLEELAAAPADLSSFLQIIDRLRVALSDGS